MSEELRWKSKEGGKINYSCDFCHSCHCCNYCDYCDSCDFCRCCDYCDYCDSCNFCHSCDSCDYCDYCNSCENLVNGFMCSKVKLKEKDPKKYWIFNKEVSKKKWDKRFEIGELV